MVSKRTQNTLPVLLLMSIGLLIALAPGIALANGLGAGAASLQNGSNALETQATKKILKPIYPYDSVAQQLGKSTLVKKTGTYALTLKNGAGIVRFKAPKTKTYSFTFSKLKSNKASSLACVIGFCKVSSSYSYAYQTVTTKEGKRPRLPLMSSKLANGKSVVFDGYSYRRLATRTGKIKLKKGASIYIAMQAKDMDDDLVRSTLNLKIS